MECDSIEEVQGFCYFIDNHPWEVPERLNGCVIKDAKFEEDKSALTLILEKDGERKKLEVTLNNTNEWLWLFLTE